jgi:hypothetical protein
MLVQVSAGSARSGSPGNHLRTCDAAIAKFRFCLFRIVNVVTPIWFPPHLVHPPPRNRKLPRCVVSRDEYRRPGARTPSMLDPHILTIEGWLAAEPQLTALAIVGRLSEIFPEQFCKKQHSIVQRHLKALRKKAAERLMAEMTLTTPTSAVLPPEAVDGAACDGHSAPPTAPPVGNIGR